MEQKIMLLIRYDHEVKGLSYRSLAFKYGISRSMVHRMIKSKAKKISQLEEQRAADTLVEEGVILPEDVQVLKESLRLANLKIALQDLMIDIAGKELGIDLRKKHGTRQSK
jgi:transposase